MLLLKDLMNKKFQLVAILYLLIAIIGSIQCYYGFIHPPGRAENIYHNYNNYILFKNSFFHLIENKDLYHLYLNEQWDLYKYSPTFSFSFGLLAYLPDFIGLIFWGLLNTMLLLIGFSQLKGIGEKNKIYALLFCSIELLGNVQNAQSNGLMAALLILAFASLENSKYLLATFLIVFSVYIKIYGGIGLVLFLFYPSKGRLIVYTLSWFLLLGALPLLVIDFTQLIHLYKSWISLLRSDQANSVGISVMAILSKWFKIHVSDTAVECIGLLVFMLPLAQISKYKYGHFRLMMLSAALIGTVIFNHKAESSTYIIAICGISIWFYSQPRNHLNIVLMILAFIFTSLSTGDIFPMAIKEEFINPYYIKCVFSIIIFGKIITGCLVISYHPGHIHFLKSQSTSLPSGADS
jgi:hypothetical protein